MRLFEDYEQYHLEPSWVVQRRRSFAAYILLVGGLKKQWLSSQCLWSKWIMAFSLLYDIWIAEGERQITRWITLKKTRDGLMNQLIRSHHCLTFMKTFVQRRSMKSSLLNPHKKIEASIMRIYGFSRDADFGYIWAIPSGTFLSRSGKGISCFLYNW